MDGSTIDITDLVESMKSSFVLAAHDYLITIMLAIPGLGPIAAWFVKVLFGPLINWLLTQLSNWAAMEVFFLNTALRKAGQANDYIDSIKQKNSLPKNATQDEYEKAERKEIAAFNQLVMLTQ